MLLLREDDVRRLLPMPDAIRLVRESFLSLARGEAQSQPRRRLILPNGSVLHSMAGAYGKYFGTKIYSTNPSHGAYFLFVLYDAETVQPLAVFEANYLGQIRTGAASGVATDLLASPDAATLAIIGSGFQARSQLEAMLAVRPLRSVRVWSRKSQRRQSFAEECEAEFKIPVKVAESAEEAVSDAQIVVTATNAREPVLEAGWVSPGAHINAMGSNQAARREIPTELVQMAALIAVDSREQARIEAGDLLLALDDAGWADPKLVEMQDLVSGKAAPRRGAGEITLFKSVGLGVQDVAVAAFVHERAIGEWHGNEFPLLVYS